MKNIIYVFVFVLTLFLTKPTFAQNCGAWPALNNARVKTNFCANKWATGGFTRPRAIVVDDAGDVIVADRDNLRKLYDDNGDGQSTSNERFVLATQSGLNHEVMIDGNNIYASSDTTVYQWNYTHGQRTPITSGSTIIIRNMPAAGNHPTRTLAAKDGLIYVHVGSGGNVDDDSERARVVRFSLTNIPVGGHDWEDGQLFADGLRNEVGIEFDRNGLLWGVQNGRDNLQRAPWGDIHIDNPCEELNSYNESNVGRFYGYPYCWSDTGMDPITGGEPGTQWADTEYFPSYTDAWCRDVTNNIPPRWCMPAHMAPLGLSFYYQETGQFAFPPDMIGDIFVTLHGSWNRVPAAGYMLRHIMLDSQGNPFDDEPLVEYNGVNPPAFGTGWIRPVDSAILPDGTLLFTSDLSAEIIAVRYMGNIKKY